MEKSPKVVEIHLDHKGQLVIPSELRQSLGFEDGDQLIVHEEGGQLILGKVSFVKVIRLLNYLMVKVLTIKST